MSGFVIDASIVVKWLLDEPLREAAKLFLRPGIIRIAPDLILIECTNAIRRKVLLKHIPQNEGDEAFALLTDWLVELLVLRKTNDLLQRAYDLSKELQQHPIPDCLYLALAERERSLLVTADRKFYNKVKSTQYDKHIAWVEESLL